MTDPEILLAATRYEKLRKLDPQKFALLWGDSLFTDTPFDELVDALPEPFRVMREEPKTCQTCKHWGDDIERKTESLDASMRECKEIFKKLRDSDPEIASYFPFSEYFKTDGSFGCNGYQQINKNKIV